MSSKGSGHYGFRLKDYVGRYIPNSIFCANSLDGSDMAGFLQKQGYKVLRNYDTGTYGRIETSRYVVSTNGYVDLANKWKVAV